MVFQRRAGEADVARGAQAEQRAARLGARVFTCCASSSTISANGCLRRVITSRGSNA